MVKAEGLTRKFLPVSTVQNKLLKTFDYQLSVIKLKNPPKQWVKYETSEFSAVCPYSGLPDIGTLIIEYIPNKKIIELKSLKYYLLSYREVGIYQEHATQLIYQDILNITKPKRLIITTIYNTRGGIDTTCQLDSKN